MKTLETVHVYDGFWQRGARCGLQIFPGGDGTPVVVLTELPFNNNTSVTNLVEYLAAEVLASYLPERIGRKPPFHCVEHYPRREGSRLPETFDLVTFDLAIPERRRVHRGERFSLGTPHWQRITRGELERLIGHPYPRAPEGD